MQHALALLHRTVGILLGIGVAAALRVGVGSAIGIAIATWTTPALAAEPSPEALVAELPFLDHASANRIFIDLAPEGHRPLRMLLDTGATASVLTPGYARSLGVSVRRVKNTPYRRSTSLGRDLQFWIDTRSSDTGSRTGWEFGLLGGEFLAKYVVEIDFAARMVRFYNPKKFEVPKEGSAEGEDEASLRLSLVSNRPFLVIPASDGSRKKVRLLLDTGAPAPALMSGKAAEKLGIDVEELPVLGTIGGVLGETEARLYEDEDFDFGPFSLGRVSVLIAPRGFYNMGGSDDSLIGFDVLQQFRLRIDYPRKRLWLKRVEHGPVTFGGANADMMRRTGAYMYQMTSGAYQVAGVLEGSPAERFGLRSDDVVNPRPVFATQKRPGPDEIAEAILTGSELMVARRSGELLVDLLLPEVSATPVSQEPDDGG